MEPAFRFLAGATPLLVSAPHVGTHIPADLAQDMTEAGREVPDTDWHMDRLYDFAGLAAAKSALRKGGVLAIWSAGPDRSFTERLRMSGFSVEEKKVRANASGGGARHVVWLATAAAADRDRSLPESTSSRRGPRRR